MIQISNGKVIIDGKHTTDPTLIGYALLDAAENSIHQFDKNTVTETFYNYIANNGLRKTFEREQMLSIVLNKMDQFCFEKLKVEARKQRIALASIYHFKNLLIKSEILIPEKNIPCMFNINSKILA